MLLPLIEATTARQPIGALAARLDALGIPNAPLQDVADVAAHPQTAALGLLGAERPGGLPLVGLPLSFDGARPAMRWPAPRLGEHNDHLHEVP